ncbi:hypothetical protein JXM67_04195 [candidate division WOR-3 bacterium]|nr:hypothetical protein [candidate division WOR-3 bacterium]
MSNCSKTNVYQAIADWANVQVTTIKPETQLDGLGGKSWPDDAPPLITTLEDLCSITIPQESYTLFESVDDIGNFLGGEDHQYS